MLSHSVDVVSDSHIVFGDLLPLLNATRRTHMPRPRCIGREFQALGQATMKARGPIVKVWHVGTRTSPEAAERRCDRPVTLATEVHSMARYRGAESFRQRKARRDILNSIRDLMSSQLYTELLTIYTELLTIYTELLSYILSYILNYILSY